MIRKKLHQKTIKILIKSEKSEMIYRLLSVIQLLDHTGGCLKVGWPRKFSKISMLWFREIFEIIPRNLVRQTFTKFCEILLRETRHATKFCERRKWFCKTFRNFSKIILQNKFLMKCCEISFAKLITQQNFAKYKNCFSKISERNHFAK